MPVRELARVIMSTLLITTCIRVVDCEQSNDLIRDPEEKGKIELIRDSRNLFEYIIHSPIRAPK
uniref:Uncharacterized protein n=1 Tax=Setaria viridis TaxID=4556 RepID=A0A4U6UGM0_SETVI|nr:hypothetical protein SEVIR_5G216150v2 [Setaria viridis]